MDNTKAITVETFVNAPVEKVWETWTAPWHIVKWNHASDDWHTPSAENDLKVGGKFNFRMEAKVGNMGFNFSGVYDAIDLNKKIAFTLDDGRKVKVTFLEENGSTKVTETFQPESANPIEMQKAGWQAILDNFKKYTEE